MMAHSGLHGLWASRGLDGRQEDHSGGCCVGTGQLVRARTQILSGGSYVAGRVLAGTEMRDGSERYPSCTFRLFPIFHAGMKVCIHTALHTLRLISLRHSPRGRISRSKVGIFLRFSVPFAKLLSRKTVSTFISSSNAPECLFDPLRPPAEKGGRKRTPTLWLQNESSA